MTPEHKALVAELLDPNFEGAFQHVRSYSEIDRLFRQAASAIESLSAQCAQLQAGEPTGYIDRQRQKFASIEKHDIATLAKGGWTPVYLASPQPANPAQVTDAVRADWQRIDDALVSCASLIRALASDDVATVAAAELDYVRSALAASHMPVVDGPVPSSECPFHLGQAVHLAEPYAEQDPSTVHYVTGIEWEYRAVAHRGWDITIATAEEIERGYGATTGFAPGDLLTAARAGEDGR